jgi:hypothetical protein
MPVFLDSRANPSGAISVSALVHRTALETLEGAAEEIRKIIETAVGPVTR